MARLTVEWILHLLVLVLWRYICEAFFIWKDTTRQMAINPQPSLLILLMKSLSVLIYHMIFGLVGFLCQKHQVRIHGLYSLDIYGLHTLIEQRPFLWMACHTCTSRQPLKHQHHHPKNINGGSPHLQHVS